MKIDKVKEFFHIPDYKKEIFYTRINVVLFHKFFRCKEIGYIGRNINPKDIVALAMVNKKEKYFVNKLRKYPDFRIEHNKEILINAINRIDNLEIKYTVLAGSEFTKHLQETYKNLEFHQSSESDLGKLDQDKNSY